jgi:hypothetical protein
VAKAAVVALAAALAACTTLDHRARRPAAAWDSRAPAPPAIAPYFAGPRDWDDDDAPFAPLIDGLVNGLPESVEP